MFADLQTFDWIMGIILLVFLISGIKNGLIGSIINLVGIVVAFIIIGKLIPVVESYLILNFGLNQLIAHIVSYIILILAFAIVIKLVIWLMNSMLKLLRLSILNRILGAVFGLFAGFFFLILLVSVINVLPTEKISDKLNDNSRYYANVEEIAYKYIYQFGDKFEDTKKKIEKTVDNANEKIDDGIDKIKEMDDLVDKLNNDWWDF